MAISKAEEKVILQKLTSDILASAPDQYWTGYGYGSRSANADALAKMLATSGVFDLKQLGARTYIEEETGRQRTELFNKDTGKPLQSIGWELPSAIHYTLMNPDAGFIEDPYSGNAIQFARTFAGEGGTNFNVAFDAQGKPHFFTSFSGSTSDFNDVAPIAAIGLGLLAPGIGNAIGAALAPAASAAVQAAIGSAVIGGTMAEASGGDFLTGALTGAAGSALSPVTSAISETVGSEALGRALTSGAMAEATGGDFTQAALTGALIGAINEAKLAAAEDYINSIAPGTSYEADLPTSQDVLDIIAAEQPSYQISDTTFTPDYSLSTGAPVIPEMWAQGIQGPTINEVIDILDGADYSIPIPDSGIGLVMPTAPNLESMGGAQGVTIPVSGGTLTEVGVIPETYIPVLGDETSFINQPVPEVSVNIPEIVEQPKDISGELAAAEDYINSIAPGTEMGAQGIQVPTINEVVETIGQPVDYSLPVQSSGIGLQLPVIENLPELGGAQGITIPVVNAPEFVAPDTSFTPDYSLNVGSPVIPEMGAQGIQVPTINEVIDVVNQPVDYSLPIPETNLNLVMPTVPNIDSMGGGQGITVPVSGGTLTESGVIPETYVPVLGDESSFINQPAPEVSVNIPEAIEQPKDISGELAALDVAKALAPIVVGALTAGSVVNAIQEDQPTGFEIVPIPSEWKSPEYNMAFTPSAPIDFGSPELLRGTQWERPMSLSTVINALNQPMIAPEVQQMMTQFQAPTMPYETGINDIIGEIGGRPVSIAEIISGIQSGQNYGS